MSRTRKLAPVVDMVRKATESELARLGETNALLQREQYQLDDLIRYREEYLLRFRQDDPMVMTAKKALELRAFLAQLDQAIHAQQLQVNQSRSQVNKQQKIWLQARNKEQAMDSLMSRYQAQDVKLEQRREQRETDEHTNSIWLRKQKDHL
jgi:flagellar FliJ protein